MTTEEQYAEYVITSMVRSIEPIVVERAAGAIIYGADGKEYLDCFAGISVSNVGHCHPRVVAAAQHADRCRYCNGDCTLACADAVEDVIKYETSGDVAAFIAEPVMGEGGILMPHRDYFSRVMDILDRYSILFIADEVQTGFGRT